MQTSQDLESYSILGILRSVAGNESFAHLLTDLLVDLCNIDTVPTDDQMQNHQSESAVYHCIEQAIRQHGLSGTFIQHQIQPQIQAHPAYTKPYYQHDENYGNRYNLIHLHCPAGAAGGVALNAHIDTVKPYFPPIVENGAIIGRGASDDKGCCVAIIGALVLLEHVTKETGIALRKPVVSMFVTDEESGGNGSLSVALDRSLASFYDTILICESTEGRLHPANRGAVWFKLELDGPSESTVRFAFKAVKALDACGSTLRAESNHPLFADKPVQTCHGMLGLYGEHPSRTCSKVVLRIDDPPPQVREYIEKGLEDYIAAYGDRTTIIDKDSGKVKLDHHFDIDLYGERCELTVWGTAGHMGKALENDSAIVKAAWIVDQLYSHIDARFISLAENSEGTLVLEGGQGFLPTHTIEEVKHRMRNTISDLYESSRAQIHALEKPHLTFDKLHNDAFARDPESKDMKLGLHAARLLGVNHLEPVVGFPVSCDARIFAREYPEKQVITLGPGSIAFAHTDSEQITQKELVDGALQLALSILLMTGTCSPEDVS